MKECTRKSGMSKKGVFGLTSVQSFFAILLGLALLAYVMIVIFGTLEGANILTNTGSGTATNESHTIAGSYVALTYASYPAVACTLTRVHNSTGGEVLTATNYTQSNCYLKLGVASEYNNTILNATYTYTYSTGAKANAYAITGNVSGGVTSFFSSITPVYAILAVLVIILVLVVLVRVVSGGGAGMGSGRGEAPI